MPEIKNVYSTTIENYRHELVPVICVEWTVSGDLKKYIIGFFLHLFWKSTFRKNWYRLLTEQMPFLSFSQQYQSAERNLKLLSPVTDNLALASSFLDPLLYFRK